MLNLIPAPGGGRPLLTVGQRMLIMLALGVLAFSIGRLIEGNSGKSRK